MAIRFANGASLGLKQPGIEPGCSSLNSLYPQTFNCPWI